VGYVVNLLFALVVSEAALTIAVVFVMAWREQDLAAAATLGAALFSMILVVMVAVREAL
jgi:cytochrome c oxidase subunit IV